MYYFLSNKMITSIIGYSVHFFYLLFIIYEFINHAQKSRLTLIGYKASYV